MRRMRLTITIVSLALALGVLSSIPGIQAIYPVIGGVALGFVLGATLTLFVLSSPPPAKCFCRACRSEVTVKEVHHLEIVCDRCGKEI